jgi:hypothetical protein
MINSTKRIAMTISSCRNETIVPAHIVWFI